MGAGCANADVLAVGSPHHTADVVILRLALHELHAHVRP